MHEERIVAMRKQARPPHDQIAENLNDLESVKTILAAIETLEDPAHVPATTSLQSEKKKWARKVADEKAARETPPPA